MAVTRDPIFVAKEICDFDFRILDLPSDLCDKIQSVVLGQENIGGACSMNTKVVLVEPKKGQDISASELETLRKKLLEQICPPKMGSEAE
jgi:hypothetical protein